MPPASPTARFLFHPTCKHNHHIPAEHEHDEADDASEPSLPLLASLALLSPRES